MTATFASTARTARTADLVAEWGLDWNPKSEAMDEAEVVETLSEPVYHPVTDFRKGDDLYVRFMSEREYRALMMGETLANRVNHAEHANSESAGFCFLALDTLRDMFGWASDPTDCDLAKYAYAFLSGIVTDDKCVIFRNYGAELRRSSGLYADPYCDELMSVEEYCIESYNAQSMVPVKTIHRSEYDWSC